MSAKEILKVGVIGVGAMGRNHARVYADMPDVTLVGIADKDIEAAGNVARRQGGQVMRITGECSMSKRLMP